MIRPRMNAPSLFAALLLACSAACAQGLVVRQPGGKPEAASQDPKADSELQQEIRALREQAAHLEILVEQLKQRAEQPKGEMREVRRLDVDGERMLLEQARAEQEQQERKRAAAVQIAQVEKRAQDEIARIKQNAQREIERIQGEVAQRQPYPRKEPAEGSPMFVRSYAGKGQPQEVRAVRVRSAQEPQRSKVQVFEVSEDGQPVRRVEQRDDQRRGDERLDDPEIDRLLEALRNRIAERRQGAQFRGRVIAPQEQERHIEVQVETESAQGGEPPIQVRRVRTKKPSTVAAPPPPPSPKLEPDDGDDDGN